MNIRTTQRIQNTVINKGIWLLIKTGDKTPYEHWTYLFTWTVPCASIMCFAHTVISVLLLLLFFFFSLCIRVLYGRHIVWVNTQKRRVSVWGIQPRQRQYKKKMCKKNFGQTFCKGETRTKEKKTKNNYAIIDGKYPVIKTMKSIFWCNKLKQQHGAISFSFRGNSNLASTQINQMRVTEIKPYLSNNAIVNWVQSTKIRLECKMIRGRW